MIVREESSERRVANVPWYWGVVVLICDRGAWLFWRVSVRFEICAARAMTRAGDRDMADEGRRRLASLASIGEDC